MSLRPVLALALFGLLAGALPATPPEPELPAALFLHLELVSGPDAKGRFQAEAVVETRVRVEELRLRWNTSARVRLDRGPTDWADTLGPGDRKRWSIRGRVRGRGGPPVISLVAQYPFPLAGMQAMAQHLGLPPPDEGDARPVTRHTQLLLVRPKQRKP